MSPSRPAVTPGPVRGTGSGATAVKVGADACAGRSGALPARTARRAVASTRRRRLRPIAAASGRIRALCPRIIVSFLFWCAAPQAASLACAYNAGAGESCACELRESAGPRRGSSEGEMLSRIVVIVAVVAFVLGGFGMAGDPMGSPSTLRSRAAGYGECAGIGSPDRRRYRGRMDWAEVVAE